MTVTHTPLGTTHLVAALGAESGISKSEVSRICAGLDEMVAAFRDRPLGHIAFPYVYVDATYLKVRNSVGPLTSMAMVAATRITADANPEILGCDIGDSNSEGFWQQFLASLRQRGLTGVRLVIADAHRGLAAPADRVLQRAARQPCRVHFIPNLLALVPKTHQHMAAQSLRPPQHRRVRGGCPAPSLRLLTNNSAATSMYRATCPGRCMVSTHATA